MLKFLKNLICAKKGYIMSSEIENLKWLVDAPMFIDEKQVDRFYDAIAKPEYIEESYSKSSVESHSEKISAKLKVEAKSELLSTIFPFIPKISAEAGGEVGSNSSNSEKKELKTIKNSERNLSKLTYHYLAEETDRVLFINSLDDASLLDQESIRKSPRLLTFLDIPAGTEIIPAAAEFENGKIELIFEELKAKNGENPPLYPEKPEQVKERKEYWKWFKENFSATKAMVKVEEAASRNGKIRWIAYRIPLDENGNTLHLHVAARENYDTGTLAYNFIKRGYKHGLRLVGTLKSEPDMNVLAIYEK